MHMVESDACSPVELQLERRRAGDAGTGHAERMTKRDRAAIAVYPPVIVGNAESRNVASPCEAKASFSSIDVEIGRLAGRAAP